VNGPSLGRGAKHRRDREKEGEEGSFINKTGRGKRSQLRRRARGREGGEGEYVLLFTGATQRQIKQREGGGIA
jgi:hypothetical protein